MDNNEFEKKRQEANNILGKKSLSEKDISRLGELGYAVSIRPKKKEAIVSGFKRYRLI